MQEGFPEEVACITSASSPLWETFLPTQQGPHTLLQDFFRPYILLAPACQGVLGGASIIYKPFCGFQMLKSLLSFFVLHSGC